MKTTSVIDDSNLEFTPDGEGAAFDKNYRAISTALANHGVELGHYQRAAVLRRVRRRMYVRDISTIEEYGPSLANDAREVSQLLRELQMPQGILFRDSVAVAALTQVLPTLYQNSALASIWVPGCDGGEECFAVAMLADSALGSNDAYRVFGTDTDAEALRRAQAGDFPESSIGSLPRVLRERYLNIQGDSAQASEAILRRCVFLQHEMLRPSPFFDIDIIVCRNLLYYLTPELQQQILRSLYSAMRPGGLLILGDLKLPFSFETLFEPSLLGRGLYVRSNRLPLRSESCTDPSSALASAHTAALFATSTPMLLLDDDYLIVEANPAAMALYVGEATPLGRRVFDLVDAPDRRRLFDTVRGLPSGQSAGVDLRLTDGRTARMRLSGLTSAPISILAECAVDDESEATSRAADSDRFSHTLMRTLNEAVVLTDAAGNITSVNHQAEKLAGWSRADVLNQPYGRIFALASFTKTQLEDPLKQALAGVDNQTTGSEFYLRHRDGRRIAVEARARCVPGGGGVLVLEDVSERNLLNEELAYRATHDSLTGLLNREEFHARMRAAHLEVRRGVPGRSAVLCYIDVDQFKVINDTLGHAAGDEMLHELAGELRVHLQEKDAFARLGGDEFGVLLRGTGLKAAREVVDALILAARRFRFQWINQSYAVTISVGVAEIDANTEDVSSAMSMADAACFAAKDAGRDRARFVGEDSELARRYIDMSLVGKLGRSLDDNRIVLHYEDVEPLDSPGKVVYRELLVRVRDENGDLLAPSAFIQAAEKYFLMGALDRSVLRSAFRGIAQLPDDDVIYAVNISGQSLSDERFLSFVIDEIESSGVVPERLCFEITETAAVSRLSEAVRFITRIRDFGCRFALDDFGAGMASFSYLKNFDVDFLKIDGSFVRSMLSSSVDRGMVESMNRLGHDFGLRTIAEHIENRALLEPLLAMGVDWGQGHGIARSRPFDELLKLNAQ